MARVSAGTIARVWVKRRPTRHGHAHTSLKARPQADAERELAAWAMHQAHAERWRRNLRPRALQLIAAGTATLTWSPALLTLLLEELHVDDLFLDLVGRPETIPVRRYPQAIAVAVALRHSWRRDDLTLFATRLGVKLTSKTLRYE